MQLFGYLGKAINMEMEEMKELFEDGMQLASPSSTKLMEWKAFN
jgi:hypothetical protein